MEYRLKNVLSFYTSLFFLLPQWLNLDINQLSENTISGYMVNKKTILPSPSPFKDSLKKIT